MHRLAMFFAAALPCLRALADANYDESATFAFDTRDSNSTHYGESAVFAFDTRAFDGLRGAGLSGTFFIDTRGPSAMPPLQIAGTVRDAAGTALPGASVELKRYETPFWQGTSAVGGTFTTPTLPAANYTVVAAKTGYVTSITSLPGGLGGTYPLEIRLTPMPAVAATQTVVRTPQESALNSSAALETSVLKILNGNGFDPVTTLNPSLQTVVLTHGWISNPDEWAKPLALLIRNKLLPQQVNILAWDWQVRAASTLPSTSRASADGEALGKALYAAFPGGYSQHIHFIGHSMGTIVNAYASNYAHGDLPGEKPSPAWSDTLTQPHITLLDEAEIASFLGQDVLADSKLFWKALATLAGTLNAQAAAVAEDLIPDWKSPIPKKRAWVDNYISAVGFHHEEATNIVLLAPVVGLQAQTLEAYLQQGKVAHAYSHLWYRNSVNNGGTGANLGFGISMESGHAFPPGGTGTGVGAEWYENLNTGDAFDITQSRSSLGLAGILVTPVDMPFIVGAGKLNVVRSAAQNLYDISVVPLDATGQAVLNSYEATIHWVGDLGGTAIYKTGQVVTSVTQKLGLWWDARLDRLADVLNNVEADNLLVGPMSAGVLRVKLKKQPVPAQGGLAASGGLPAYAWFTVQVPEDAGMLAFDFTVTGDPSEDRIACAINEQNLFSLPAKFAPDGSPVSTDMMDVSAYAGQTVELFFGLSGGTSTDCEVAIDGIRFITIPKPKVALGLAAANVQVKWPAAASGWVLESTTTLSPADWQAEPLDAGVSAESGVLTLEQPINSSRKFYRLRRTP